METKTYVWCDGCRTSFSEFFQDFKKCPTCEKSKLTVVTNHIELDENGQQNVFHTFQPVPYFGNLYVRGEFQKLLRLTEKDVENDAKRLY